MKNKLVRINLLNGLIDKVMALPKGIRLEIFNHNSQTNIGMLSEYVGDSDKIKIFDCKKIIFWSNKKV